MLGSPVAPFHPVLEDLGGALAGKFGKESRWYSPIASARLTFGGVPVVFRWCPGGVVVVPGALRVAQSQCSGLVVLRGLMLFA